MLDLLHYYFEDDMLPRWEQDSDIKSKVRSIVYREMYKREYKYGITDEIDRHSEWGTDVNGGGPPSGIYSAPMDGSIKPYIPPTSQEELFSILEPPMGQ